MIIQLPDGRIIEMSLEHYLELSDQEIKDLNSLGVAYTKDCVQPFYHLYSKNHKGTSTDQPKDLTESQKEFLDNRKDTYYFPDKD